jgi:uncharacterized protein
MGGLKPRKPDDDFFGWFEQAADNDVTAARMLDQMCREFATSNEVVRQLKELEHKGDGISHAVYQKLNKVFMPPLDREDIIAITIALDDVMDHIHEAGDAMCIYNIDEPTAVARELATVIMACTAEVKKQMPNLRNRRGMQQIEDGVIEIHRLENQADALLRQGTIELFHQAHDPIRVIAWTRIYETMENVTDRCEDIADVLRGLVIKHA